MRVTRTKNILQFKIQKENKTKYENKTKTK